MRLPSWWDTPFFVELILLAVAAPILYFPQRFSLPILGLGVGLLLATWLWRRWRLGIWYAPIAAAGPIFFLILIMLPVAVWVAPAPLRLEHSWPKAWVLLWNFCLFWTLVTHLTYKSRLIALAVSGLVGVGILIALTAPLGTNWLHKLPLSEQILSRLPSVLTDLSREGGSGFHPNTIAGALLYVFPLPVAVTWKLTRRLRSSGADNLRPRWGFWLLGTGCTLYMGIVLVMLQSRSGYIGLGVGLLTLALIDHRLGRRLLGAGVLLFGIVVTLFPAQLVELLADAPPAEAMGGAENLTGFRVNLWQHTLALVQDFPLTGIGLGTFPEVAPLYYPVSVFAGYYMGHAHNFWLQIAMDFGVPGLLAVLTLYALAVISLIRAWRATRSSGILPFADPDLERALVRGLIGCLTAQTVYSLTDSISMGATANLLFWYLFALILALGYQAQKSLQQTP
ncbi:MAG: O-antigen ligase family protein [Litorilinea sp.]